jgi:[protein-PII] uridylyltransferase
MALERGAAWCRAHTQSVDEWLAGLFAGAVGEGADAGGLALVAVGGYGRAELAPQSDIDVMLLHDRSRDVNGVADRLWYPIWDKGVKLGHSVATVAEALEVAANDLDTATALLSARLVAGDPALADRLGADARRRWERGGRAWLEQLRGRVEQRHAGAGEVAFQLEPDLKDGRGGLRDVHSLHWAAAAGAAVGEGDLAELATAYEVLLDARVELQRSTGKPANVLTVDEQPAVASALGLDPDALMARIAAAGRAIAWISDDTWRRAAPAGGRRLWRGSRAAETVLPKDADPAAEPVLILRLAASAATRGMPIERASLDRLAAEAAPLPDPWPAEARQRLVELLGAGRAAIPVVEALDQRGAWVKVLPEWEPLRSRPQPGPYHRFTVDRHLLETAANAAALQERVERPDLLLLVALFHDIGKTGEGDHTDEGVRIARRVGARMGLSPDDVDTIAAVIEHHLLLADVATKRDLDDAALIERVAGLIGTPQRLELLAALTEADSLATGPWAWGRWKAKVVGRLAERVAAVLDGRGDDGVERFPSAAQLERLAAGGEHVVAHDDVLTVMTDDRPGVFSRVAGVLALNGLDVLAAAAYSSAEGRALNEFRVIDRLGRDTRWAKVEHDIRQALAGRLAVHARVAERARTYGRRAQAVSAPIPASVRFDNDDSADATVIDVHAPDGVGVLYAITRALADHDLDIRSARVQTMGHEVVDAFYVRDGSGSKITDAAVQAEIERAIVHALSG